MTANATTRVFPAPASPRPLLDADIGHDATDCRAAVEAGTATFNGGGSTAATSTTATTPASGARTANATIRASRALALPANRSTADLGHDATDCRAAVEAGTATFNGDDVPVAAFDYGSDWSKWANDGECDDLRFTGEGVDKKLLTEDMHGRRHRLQDAGSRRLGQHQARSIRPNMPPAPPMTAADIDFGDNSSSYANDDQCDDPRFEGPGTASTLLDSDLEHDSADCKAAYEAGTIVLREDAYRLVQPNH